MTAMLAPDQQAPSLGRPNLTLSKEATIDGTRELLVPIVPGRHAALNESGTLVLAQSQDGSIRFFNRAGIQLGTFGHRGEGPGEFRAVSRVGWIGDTAWVYDSRLNRLTFVSPQLKLLRTEAVPTAIADGVSSMFEISVYAAENPSGTLALLTRSTAPGSKIAAPDATFVRLSSGGRIERTVAKAPAADDQIVLHIGGVTTVATKPLVPRPMVAASPNGKFLAFVLTDATRHTLEISVRDVGNGRATNVRIPYVQNVIPRAARDSIMRAASDRLTKQGAALAAAYRHNVSVPSEYPPVASVTVTIEGGLVLEGPEKAGGKPLSFIDPRGRFLGTAIMPSGSHVVAATQNDVWVTARNEDDVDSLIMYHVIFR